MKIYIAILAVCLVSANAGSINPSGIEYESLIKGLLKEMAVIAKDASVALKQQLEEIVLDPLIQVETSIVSIEKLRKQNEQCVAEEDERIFFTVGAMHNSMSACTTTAANTSAAIMTDISAASQQLLFGGYDVMRMKKKCDSYTNAWLRDSCLARFSIKATLYLANARKSINTIKKGTNERVPAVLAEANSCTHAASEEAVMELDKIKAVINECIAQSETVEGGNSTNIDRKHERSLN